MNDDYEVDDKNAQMMCNIFCYNNKVSAFNPRGKKKINIILQNKLYDTFEKHVNTQHTIIKILKQINNSLKKSLKKQPNQKKL